MVLFLDVLWSTRCMSAYTVKCGDQREWSARWLTDGGWGTKYSETAIAAVFSQELRT